MMELWKIPFIRQFMWRTLLVYNDGNHELPDLGYIFWDDASFVWRCCDCERRMIEKEKKYGNLKEVYFDPKEYKKRNPTWSYNN